MYLVLDSMVTFSDLRNAFQIWMSVIEEYIEVDYHDLIMI